MVSKYVQQNFPVGPKIFLGEVSPPPGYRPVDVFLCLVDVFQTFSCVLYAHSQFLCSLVKFDLAKQGLRQSVQPHTFKPKLLVIDETLAQPHFAVVNCSDVEVSVFHSPILTPRLIFLQL